MIPESTNLTQTQNAQQAALLRKQGKQLLEVTAKVMNLCVANQLEFLDNASDAQLFHEINSFIELFREPYDAVYYDHAMTNPTCSGCELCAALGECDDLATLIEKESLIPKTFDGT